MKGDQGTARAINRRAVLRHLRADAGISRAELSARIGLSRAAITAVVGEMLEEGLVVEGMTTKSRTGRKPISLSINYASRLAIGFRYTASGVEGVLTDLSTEVLAAAYEPYTDTAPEQVLEATIRLFDAFREQAEGRPITGVGIGVPGLVDVRAGCVNRSFRLGWRDVPIARMLASRINLPVWVDDDMNSYALNHLLFGVGTSHQTVGVFVIEDGIASSTIIDGRVRKGAFNSAGKLGHLQIDPKGDVCECGQRGCIQTFYALPVLTRRWQACAGRDAPSLFEAIDDPRVVALLEEAGEAIGRLIDCYAITIDPSVIVLGGAAMKLGPALTDPIIAQIRNQFSPGKIEVQIDRQGHSWARGAAALATQNLFDFETAGAIDGHLSGSI